jgi:hypothetical protein
MMDTPFADLKIEVMQARQVGLGLRWFWRILRRMRGRNWIPCGGQDAGRERDAEIFHGIGPFFR